ncbi:nuclear RNA export factor 1 isoform X2 [Procambarus clarkii]|nr:nuclear RNA export factor 1-like [Procambarus clarkii]
MGRKSRRLRRIEKPNDILTVNDEMMALDMSSTVKPKSAKQSSKLKKKLKKQLKKQLKQEQLERHHEKGREKTKASVTWHTVQVEGGVTVEKNFLFSSISNFLEVEFQPLGFHKMESKSCFYLEANEPAATAIQGLSNRVQGPDGSRLKITSSKCEVPDLVLNLDQLQVLREVMSRRFNAAVCLLDLTDLHHDPVLMEKDILAPLCSTVTMKQVLRLIKENVPQLKALNLSKNNLRVSNFKLFQIIKVDSSQLTALNLEHNRIGDIQVLKHIKMFPLTELSLQHNPLVNAYKENPLKYIMTVKKELKALKMLDTVDIDTYLSENTSSEHDKDLCLNIPKPDTSESTSSSSSCVMSEQMVQSFLEQFYALIDTQQRNNLVAAYTPDAVLQVKSSLEAIASQVFVGHSEISEALNTLPGTQHQHNTFSLNIQFPNVNIAQAVVGGMCQIAGVDTSVTFSRSMTIVPFNTGLCCSQDNLELR